MILKYNVEVIRMEIERVNTLKDLFLCPFWETMCLWCSQSKRNPEAVFICSIFFSFMRLFFQFSLNESSSCSPSPIFSCVFSKVGFWLLNDGSTMMLFQLVEAGLIHMLRDDVVVFNNFWICACANASLFTFIHSLTDGSFSPLHNIYNNDFN